MSADWQERWGHPVLVVESFVDETRYRGACYRACGFTAVGATGGFARASRDFYQHHGTPKQLYLRELCPGARRRRRPARLPAAWARHEAAVTGPCSFRAPALQRLLDRLATRLKKVNPPPGTWITADAMPCQQKSARFITQQLGGDYLLGLKGHQSGLLKRAQTLLSQPAPPQGEWDKGHGRLVHRRLARLAVTPEQIGLGGCWQVIAGRRQVLDLTRLEKAADDSVGYYATSLTVDQHDETALLGIIRGHWSAIENGTHHRRDVTLGEDACTTKHRGAAGVLASLRNLAIGAYELERQRGQTKIAPLKSWCEQPTFTRAGKLLHR